MGLERQNVEQDERKTMEVVMVMTQAQMDWGCDPRKQRAPFGMLVPHQPRDALPLQQPVGLSHSQRGLTGRWLNW